MRLVEAVPAVFLIFLSMLVLFGTTDLVYWAGITPGPRFFPVWIAGVGIALSIALLVQLHRGTDSGTTDLPERGAFARVALATAAMAAFVVAMPLIGVVPAVVVFMMFILLVVLGQRAIPSAAAAAIVAGAIEIVFVQSLKIALPPIPFL
jgi:putative tricarboxylic transport membrane protein